MRLAEKLGAFIDLFYIKPFSALVSPTVFRYAACGGVNMVLDLVMALDFQVLLMSL